VSIDARPTELASQINALTTELAAFAASALVSLKATDMPSRCAGAVAVSDCQCGSLHA
jgi:hypothetical protein